MEEVTEAVCPFSSTSTSPRGICSNMLNLSFYALGMGASSASNGHRLHPPQRRRFYIFEEAIMCTWNSMRYVIILHSKSNTWWKYLVLISLFFALVLFNIFVLMLLLFHSYLVITNQTSYKFLRRQRPMLRQMETITVKCAHCNHLSFLSPSRPSLQPHFSEHQFGFEIAGDEQASNISKTDSESSLNCGRY